MFSLQSDDSDPVGGTMMLQAAWFDPSKRNSLGSLFFLFTLKCTQNIFERYIILGILLNGK